jgi:hypothetical protein
VVRSSVAWEAERQSEGRKNGEVWVPYQAPAASRWRQENSGRHREATLNIHTFSPLSRWIIGAPLKYNPGLPEGAELLAQASHGGVEGFVWQVEGRHGPGGAVAILPALKADRLRNRGGELAI